MHRDFHGEHEQHPRFHNLSRSKLTSCYPWNSCKGKPENCVCHIHYGLAIGLAEYHYNTPRFHRAYASNFAPIGPVRPTITCATCKDHPFNGPKTFAGNERRRLLQGTRQAMTVLLCAHATTPGPQANVGCCRGDCAKCGWDRLVPRCEAEWSDTGTFTWREVVYEELANGQKRYAVKRVTGIPRQQMERLRLAITKFPMHEFLTRWQSWAHDEIPRQMPENHYTTIVDYIMKPSVGAVNRKQFAGHFFTHDCLTILCFVTRTVTGAPRPVVSPRTMATLL
jgi:hypothetical protein